MAGARLKVMSALYRWILQPSWRQFPIRYEAAALWPDRCIGLVPGNGYLVQHIAKAVAPMRPESEVPLCYQSYFQLERGRTGPTANHHGIASSLRNQWSPGDEQLEGRSTSVSRLTDVRKSLE